MNEYTDFLSFNNVNFQNEFNFIGPIKPALHLCNPQFMTYLIDRGVHFSAHFPLNLSIGDGDSSQKNLDILYNSDKDFSDLEGALKEIPLSDSLKLHLYGFLGGRLDHELINLGVLFQFLQYQKRAQVTLYDSLGPRLMGISAGEWNFSGKGIFSILNLCPGQIELTGALKYPYQGIVNTLTSLTLSNEIFGQSQVKTKHPIFFYSLQN